MFNNESTHWIKVEAIIIDLIVASLIVLGLIGGVKLIFGKQIKSAIEVIDMVSISTDSNVISEIKFDKEVQEIKEYPDCIVGIVSEIPQYETWGSDNVNVNGRIWIKIK